MSVTFINRKVHAYNKQKRLTEVFNMRGTVKKDGSSWYILFDLGKDP